MLSALPPPRPVSATWPVRWNSHGKALASMTPSLEELSEFEVELPARCRTPLRINLVEPIPYVYAQGSQGAQGAHSEAEAAKQTGRAVFSPLVPDVAALDEGVLIQQLIHPQPKFGRPHEERIAE